MKTSGSRPNRGELRASDAFLPVRPAFWPTTWPWSYALLAFVLVAAVTVARYAVLLVTPLDLVPDEAQYWSWAQNFEFGYFSKPPMIAWVIAATTGVCGDSEACVRAGAPLLHAGTAFFIFLLADALFGARTAFWSAITYILIPGVAFSATLISTDVPLLFFWALGLYALAETIRRRTNGEGRALAFAALTGFAIGLGFLSKYAMIYFLIGALLLLVASPSSRRALLSPLGGVIALVAVLTLLPNVLWNWAEGWPTARHTAANANWGAELFNVDKLGEFIVGQFGVFGPLPLVIFIWGLMTWRRRREQVGGEATTFLLCFAAPALLIVIGQSFISRAHANWAAPSYVSLTVLVVQWMLAAGGRAMLIASSALHLVAATGLYAIFASPYIATVTATQGMLKRARAWDELGDFVAAEAAKAPYTAIMGDDRLLTAELTYYARDVGLPIVMWDMDGHAQNHFEFRVPFRADLGSPILYASPSVNPVPVLERFETATPLGLFDLPAKTEKIRLWRLEGYKG